MVFIFTFEKYLLFFLLHLAWLYSSLFTGQFKQLVSTNDTIEGKRPMIPNSIVVGADGIVYWTDSSTSHYIYDGVFTILANGNGRLVSFKIKCFILVLGLFEIIIFEICI